MKEHIITCSLWLINLGAWTINDLSFAEVVLKLILLVLSIAVAAKQLISKKSK